VKFRVFGFAILLALTLSSFLFGYSLEEIEKLKTLGFSNEQIVEMQKSDQEKQIASSNKNEEELLSSKTINKMKELEGLKKGLLVICFSKEWHEKGPGYLDVWSKTTGEASIKLGKADIQEYTLEGQKGPTVFTHIDYNNDYLSDKSVGVTKDVITSRYYGEFEISSGTYEVEVKRNFITYADAFGNSRETRHKKFHSVKIVPGKATVLSYFWTANVEFGMDHVMSKNHIIMVNYVSKKFGELLAEVKVQHNK